MKVVKDSISNATAVFGEVCNIIDKGEQFYVNLAPYKRSDGALAQFLAKSTLGLKKATVANFQGTYSRLASVVINGEGLETARKRITQAIYRFRTLNETIMKAKCIIKTDAQRKELQGLAADAICDAVVYAILEFRLYSSDVVQLSISDMCKKAGIGSDLLYGSLLEKLEKYGGHFYAYEECSSLYGAMSSFDDAFLSDALENGWDLTEELAEKLLSGEIDSDSCRSYLIKNAPLMEGRDDLTMDKLVTNMSLS